MPRRATSLIASLALCGTLTIVAPGAATAQELQTFMLSVAVAGGGSGVVTSDDGTINCPTVTCDGTYEEGTTIVLSAAASIDSTFTGWDGDCATFGTGACFLTMDGNHTITATFDLLPPPNTFTLSVTTSGEPGLVQSFPFGIDCGATCAAEFDEGTEVTLDAFPEEFDVVFVGWGGDCASFGTDPCNLVMDGNRTVEATFAFEGADFQLLVEPGFQTLPPGGSVEYEVKVGAVAGFSAPVSLSVSGLPSGVTASFSPNPLTPSGISVLTLTAAVDAPASTAPFMVTATGGGITHEATGSTRLDIPLTPIPPDCLGTVQGVVTDAETGDPIANVQLFVNRPLEHWRPPGDTSTDASGSYSLPIQIVRSASRSFNIGAAHFGSDGLLDEYWWAFAVPRTVSCGQTVTANFSLVPEHGAQGVTGRVVEGTPDPDDYSHVIPTTTPIEGANVEVNRAQGCSFTVGMVGFARYCADLPEATSLADGTFAIDAFPVGHDNADIRSFLQADVDSSSERTGFWDESECAGCGFLDLGTVHPGQSTITDTVIPLVRKCTASISGVVSDVDGEPAAFVPVHAGSSTDNASTSTGPDGEYAFPALLLGVNNAPTNYGVSSHSPNEGSRVDVLQPVTTCGAQLTVNLRLSVGYGSVRGVVREEGTNAEIEGASVGFWFSVGPCYPDPHVNECFATTGPGNGSYRIGNLAFSEPGDSGDFLMVATKPGYWDDLQDVTITASTDGNPAATRDFLLLKKKYVVVTGVVRDLITGEPIPNACSFELSPFDGPTTCTDANGHFTSAPLELGDRNESRDICYEFEAEGHFPVEGCLTLEEAVPEPPPLEVRQMPLCTDATLTGRVTNVVTGVGIPNAVVRALGVQTPQPTDETDADGNFVLEHVRVGSSTPVDVLVRASAVGFDTRFLNAEVFCGGTVEVTGRASSSLVVRKQTIGGTGAFPFSSAGGLPSPADGAGGFSLSTASSNPAGVTFADLVSGSTYTVTEPTVAGWDLGEISCSSGPSSIVRYGSGSSFPDTAWQQGDDAIQVEVAEGEQVTCNFVNVKRSSVTVTKYADGDRDGQFGTSEMPLPGWSFFLDTDGSSTKDDTESIAVTDALGRAVFADLVPGRAYRICEVVTTGWVNTDPGSNAQPCKTTAALSPGEDVGLLFGNASALSSGARTIGFWRNRNGQSIISGNCLGADRSSGTADDLRGYLRALRPFQDLSETATCSKVATYVSNVVNRATKNRINDAKNLNAMLKAQMLATALDAYFSDPTLGGNGLGAPHPIGGLAIDLLHICVMVDDAGGSSGCVSIEDASSAFDDQATMTVTQMLNWTAGQATAATSTNPLASPWYGQDRALQRLAKDAFDAINNGIAFSATP